MQPANERIDRNVAGRTLAPNDEGLRDEQGLADEFTKGATSILAKHGPGAAPIVRWLVAAALSREPTAAE